MIFILQFKTCDFYRHSGEKVERNQTGRAPSLERISWRRDMITERKDTWKDLGF